MKQIKLIYKELFGKTYYYPNCDDSRLILKLKNAKTFTKLDLKIIRDMGIKIKLTTGAENE